MAFKTSIRLVGLLTAFLTLIFLSGCAQSGTADTGNNTTLPNTVTIQNFAFNPPELTVPVGTTVAWINKDSASHDIKFPDSLSPAIQGGGSYEKTFNEKGTFDYSCGIHPSMKGKIIVE